MSKNMEPVKPSENDQKLDEEIKLLMDKIEEKISNLEAENAEIKKRQRNHLLGLLSWSLVILLWIIMKNLA